MILQDNFIFYFHNFPDESDEELSLHLMTFRFHQGILLLFLL